MNILELLLKRPAFNKPDDAPAGDPPAESLIAAAGDDTPPAADGDDTQPAAEGDDTIESAEGDDTPKAPEGEDVIEPLTAEALVLPEGVELDADLTGEFLGLVNDSELSRAELGQKLIDLQLKSTEAAGEAINAAVQDAWNTKQDEWQAAVLALPEIGGDNVDKTLASIKSGLTAVGATDATFTALNETGAGNHPEIVQLLHNLTKHLNEGSVVQGDPPAGNLTPADKMFGKK